MKKTTTKSKFLRADFTTYEVKTSERENLDYQDFLKIYKIATKKEYLTGLDFIDDLNGLYTLKLNQVVDLLEAEETPFVIGCGAYLYRLTNKNK